MLYHRIDSLRKRQFCLFWLLMWSCSKCHTAMKFRIYLLKRDELFLEQMCFWFNILKGNSSKLTQFFFVIPQYFSNIYVEALVDLMLSIF